jgi:hypothetical protein
MPWRIEDALRQRGPNYYQGNSPVSFQ